MMTYTNATQRTNGVLLIVVGLFGEFDGLYCRSDLGRRDYEYRCMYGIGERSLYGVLECVCSFEMKRKC